MRYLLLGLLLACTTVTDPSVHFDAATVKTVSGLWTITDNGKKLVVEDATVRAEFAYGGPGTDGMFGGGGGKGCGLTYLAYKPTGPTRNLVFRNGFAGGKYDQAVLFELERTALNTSADHSTPDWTDGVNAVAIPGTPVCTWTPAGASIDVQGDFELRTLHVKRSTVIHPEGSFYTRFNFWVDTTAIYEYGDLRVMWSASRYSFATGPLVFNWGANYEADGETFACVTQTGVLVKQVVTATTNKNLSGSYVACMLDDANHNDPDIIWEATDSAQTATRNFLAFLNAKAPCAGNQPYEETALFNPSWAPAHEAHADLADFASTWLYPHYGTSACVWTAGVYGTWVKRVYFLNDSLDTFHPDSLFAFWQRTRGGP